MPARGSRKPAEQAQRHTATGRPTSPPESDGPFTPAIGVTPLDNGAVVLRADYSTHSTVVTCTLCPSFRVVAATRDAAMREAAPHAAMHGQAKQARDALRNRRRNGGRR